MSLRHIVLFKFTDEATSEQVEALAEGLSSLPGAIAEIRAYRHGPDAGVAGTSWDYALLAEFDSAEDFLAYRVHPSHQAVLQDLVEPISAQRASVQLRV